MTVMEKPPFYDTPAWERDLDKLADAVREAARHVPREAGRRSRRES
jgi:hypothetical protein